MRNYLIAKLLLAFIQKLHFTVTVFLTEMVKISASSCRHHPKVIAAGTKAVFAVIYNSESHTVSVMNVSPRVRGLLLRVRVFFYKAVRH